MVYNALCLVCWEFIYKNDGYKRFVEVLLVRKINCALKVIKRLRGKNKYFLYVINN